LSCTSILPWAAENLDRLLVQHQGTMAEFWLLRRRDRLTEGPGAVLTALTSENPESVELRQNSPFAGVLSQSQRRRVLEAFTRTTPTAVTIAADLVYSLPTVP
jgi:hypothetical protein